jgi:serine/threonine protein kinase
MALDTGTRLGPWETPEPLGSGGMGEVCKIRDGNLGRLVAIELIRESARLDRRPLGRNSPQMRIGLATRWP